MRKLAMLLAASTALASVSVVAQEVQYTDWTNMNPNSYEVTVEEMSNRCNAGAAVTTVTEAECQEVVAMIEAGQCSFEPVPDGIRYEFMNGLRGGQPFVYTNMRKQLGEVRMAFVCTTSTGRVFDWYVGEDGISCGNLGARVRTVTAARNPTPPAPPAATPVPPAPLVLTMNRREVTQLPDSAPVLVLTAPTVTYGEDVEIDRSSTTRVGVAGNAGAAACATATNTTGHTPNTGC